MATKKTPPREAARELPSIPKELLEQFSNGPVTAEAIQDASMAFKKALIERALGADLGHHLGYPNAYGRPSNMRRSLPVSPCGKDACVPSVLQQTQPFKRR